MTQIQIYADTLNLFGSDVPDPAVQEILDREHALADPAFAEKVRRKKEMCIS